MPLVKEVLIFVSHSLQVLMRFKLEKIKSIRFSTKQYTLFKHKNFMNLIHIKPLLNNNFSCPRVNM